MKIKKYFIFYFVLVSTFFYTFAKSDEKIIFVDLDYILSESVEGKKIIDELQAIKKKNEKNYNSIEKELYIKKNEITKLKNVLSKEEYNKKVLEFNKKGKNFELKRFEIEKSFEILKKKKLNTFFDNLDNIMKEYMLNNDISFILEKKNIIISKDIHDRTNDILDLINSKIK